MTDEQLEAARAWAYPVSPKTRCGFDGGVVSIADLVAEIDRLRKENETLERELNNFVDGKRLDLDRHREHERLVEAENERLRKEVARWRRSFAGHVYVDTAHYENLVRERLDARADCEIQASKIEELNGLLCEARAELRKAATEDRARFGGLRDDLLRNADDRRITAEQEAISLRSRLTKAESSLDYYKSVVAEGPHILGAGEHGPDECPTYYDGCNCTVSCLEHNIKRAESAERRLAEVEAEREKLANEQDTTRVELVVLVAKLEADLVESQVREVRLRAALEYALEGLCELISYVPAILREKHNHDEYIAETKAALDARRAVAVNAIRNVPHFYWDCTINGLAVLDQDDQTQAGLHAPKICADGGGQCAFTKIFGEDR